jgi:NAD dependent epimerase/dehydratase
LCEALVERGAAVTALVRYNSRGDWGNLERISHDKREPLRVVAGNVEDAGFVARETRGQEIVFHLAALIGIPFSYVAPVSYVRTNVEGTAAVLEAVRNCGVERLIHTSTSEVYGTALYTPIDEEHPLQGQSPYSASKIGADKLVESYYRSFDVPVTTVRPFNTYGPRQSARAVIPTIISQGLSRDEIHLGSLEPVRDLTFVKDTVEGFLLAAGSTGALGEVINIGFGAGVSIRELVDLIQNLMGKRASVVVEEERVRPPRSEVMRLVCDRSKAERLIGWKPVVSLEEGLGATAEFVSDHLHLYRSDQYAV